MNESELDALVEAKLEATLAARLRADRERVRMEVVADLRREIARKHYEKINRRAPIEDKYGGLGPEGHAARLKAMDARVRAANAHMDAVNSRPVEGSLLHTKQRAALNPGAEGFAIKGVGQR